MASDTRNRILDVAARLFEANGFEGTAVASILREADVNSGSLYHFFPSKEALLVAVLEEYLRALEPGLLRAADRATDDPAEKVFALLELYRGRLLVSGFARGCPVGNLSMEIGGRIPEARRLVAAYFEAWTTRVGQWLGEAGARGRGLSEDRAAARLVLAVLQGAIVQARAAASVTPFDQSVSFLRALPELGARDGEEATASSVGERRAWSPRYGEAASGPAAEAGSAAGSAPLLTDPSTGETVGVDEAAWWRAW